MGNKLINNNNIFSNHKKWAEAHPHSVNVTKKPTPYAEDVVG